MDTGQIHKFIKWKYFNATHKRGISNDVQHNKIKNIPDQGFLVGDIIDRE